MASGMLLLALLLGGLDGPYLFVPAMFFVVAFVWGYWIGFACMIPLVFVLSFFVNIFCDMSSNWASSYVHQIHDYWPLLVVIAGARSVVGASLAARREKLEVIMPPGDSNYPR